MMAPLRDTLDTVNQDYDICMLGTGGSGKSSFVMHYIYNRFIPDTESELEDLYTKVIRNGSSYNEITILDTASHSDTYASSRKRQLMNNSGMVFAYSITDDVSFHSIQDIFERVNQYREDMPPTVVVGLKADLEEEREVSYEAGEAFADEIGALGFFECSAVLGVNIDEALKPLVDIIVQQKNLRRRTSHSKPFDVTSVQSLKEVLSSPSPSETPERSESPVVSINNPKKLDFDSIENLKIPKFTSNSFAYQAATKAHEETPVSPIPTPNTDCNTVASNSQSPRTSTKRYTKEDVEELQARVKNHKPKSTTGCCVIT